MGIQADLKDALEVDRDAVIEVLATHGIQPTVVDRGGDDESSLLGKPAAPTFRLESADGETGFVDRQTTVRVIDTLGLDSRADADAVRDELRDHPDWDAS